MPILTRTHPDDADVDPNSSEGVDSSFSEGVHMIQPQTQAKLLSILVSHMYCWSVVRLPKSRIPVQLNTAAIAAIVVITAIVAIAAIVAITAIPCI